MSLANRDWSINMKDSKTLFTTRSVQFNQFNKMDWLDLLNIKDGNSVLEIGCGAGAFCQRIKQTFPNCKVYGVDSNERHIDFAKQSAQKAGLDISFSVSDITNLSFENEKFDVVFTYGLVDDIAIAKFLPEQYRVLKIGGKLVVLSLDGKHNINHQVVIPEVKEERLWEKLAKANNDCIKGLHKLSVYDLMTAIKRQGFINPVLKFKNILWYCPDDSRFNTNFAKQMIMACRNFDLEILKIKQSQSNGLTGNNFHELENLITERYEQRLKKLESGEICWDYSSLFVRGVIAEKAKVNIYDA